MKRILKNCIAFTMLYTFIWPVTKAQTASMILHDIPVKNTEVKNNFGILGNSLVSLPIKGGIYDLVLKTWLISPDAKLQILDYDICMNDTSLLLVLKKDSMMILAKGKNNSKQYLTKTYCTLPIGFCQVISAGRDSFFVWHFNKNYSTLYFYPGTDSLQTLLRTTDIITAFYPVNTTTLLFAMGPTLFALSPQGKPTALKNFPADIDGIAQDDKGQLLISTFKGIYAVSKTKKITLLTDEFHGLIKCNKNILFVLDRSRNKIIQLTL